MKARLLAMGKEGGEKSSLRQEGAKRGVTEKKASLSSNLRQPAAPIREGNAQREKKLDYITKLHRKVEKVLRIKRIQETSRNTRGKKGLRRLSYAPKTTGRENLTKLNGLKKKAARHYKIAE